MYPDSAPENWRDILNDLQISWAESPLHDKDVGKGEDKPHWHILLFFSGKKRFGGVQKIMESIGGPPPKVAEDPKNAIRYFCHLNHPEKHQYPVNEIKAHNGFDLQKYLEPTTAERHKLIAEMLDFCDEAGITEFKRLRQYASKYRFDWFALLCDNSAYVVNLELKSARYMAENEGR